MNRIESSRKALLLRIRGAATRRRQMAPGESLKDDRGDVPGWVLVTLMTAGLVTLLWQTAGPLLQTMFTSAMNKVSGG